VTLTGNDARGRFHAQKERRPTRALRDQHGRCPLCGELLLFSGHEPDSPSQWEAWFAAVRKAMTRQAITDDSAGRMKHRLVHAYCARRHPGGGPDRPDQQTADA